MQQYIDISKLSSPIDCKWLKVIIKSDILGQDPNAHVNFVFAIVYLSKQNQKLIMYPIDSFGTSLIFNIINSCFFLLQFLTCISMFFICSPSVFYQVHQIVFDFLQSLFRAGEFEEELLVVISDDQLLHHFSILSWPATWDCLTAAYFVHPSCSACDLHGHLSNFQCFVKNVFFMGNQENCKKMEYLDWNDGTLFPFLN